MSSIGMRRWERDSDIIIEWTLDGNIRVTHPKGSAFSQYTLTVDDGTVDLRNFYQKDAMEISPKLERAGLDVLLPEPEESDSVWARIKRLITR